MKHILDDSRRSHFWSTSRSPFSTCIYHFKAQEVNNPMLWNGIYHASIGLQKVLQKWLLWLSSRICFMVDSLYFFSLHSGFILGKWLPSFTQGSSKLSSNLNCFGDQITNKNTKTYTKWLKLLSRVLNMPIELKCQNYYSKVFKRINYKLSNSTFWVVISKCTSVYSYWENPKAQ